MRIGGLEKQSLVDWESKVVSVVFTKGCNFRCFYCHNVQLVCPGLYNSNVDISAESVVSYLRERKDWLDGVVISGGEPTIQPELKEFAFRIKDLGLLVKLDTNGTNPDLVREMINEKLVDYISMDIKTIPCPVLYNNIIGISDPEIVIRITKTLNILRNSNLPFQLRTTLIPEHHTNSIIDRLKEFCQGCSYVLQPYREPV